MRLSCFIYLFFLIFTTLVSFGQEELVESSNYEGKEVKNISFYYFDRDKQLHRDLTDYMFVKKGDAFQSIQLDKSIQNLYKSGFVDNVKFVVEQAQDDDGINLIAYVSTLPQLAQIGFQGNPKQHLQKLADKTELKAGSYLNQRVIYQAIEKLKKYYYKEGYPEIEIFYELQQTKLPQYVNLVFDVRPKQRQIIERVSFPGMRFFKPKKIAKKLSLRKKHIFSFLTDRGKIEPKQLLQQSRMVSKIYKEAGFLHVKVEDAFIKKLTGEQVELVIPVVEGKRYKVSDINFSGNKEFSKKFFLRTFLLDPGDYFSKKQLDEDLITIRAYYGSRGYADVNVQAEIVEQPGNKVEIHYRILEGEVKKVGAITIAGNNRTKDKVIRRELPLRPGDLLNGAALQTVNNRFQNGFQGYFSDVTIEQIPSVVGKGYRDIYITVDESKARTGSISAGIGASSIENFVGQFSIVERNFDISNWSNFRGGGQRFAISVRGGDSLFDGKIQWAEPWFLNRKLELGVSVYYRDSEFISDAYDLRRFGGNIYLSKPVSRNSFVRLTYNPESVNVELQSGISQSSLFSREDGKFFRQGIILEYTHDKLDSNFLPRTGYRYNVGISYTGGVLGGNVDTYSIFARYSRYWNLVGDGILSYHVRTASIDRFGGSAFVPVFQRERNLLLGGQRTLRGYDFNDVGPRDPVTLEVIGGNTVASTTLEYTFPIGGTLRLATFVDAGYVSASSWNFGNGDIFWNLGVGLRFFIPIFGQAPLAFDYAFPINSPDPIADRGARFNFYVQYGF